jgi:ATP-dependent Clp protease ATP-binding subunit ClpC
MFMNWLKSYFDGRIVPKPAPLEEFTPHAEQVLALSGKEAERFNHNFVGTEHLLLAIISFGQGTAFNVLEKMGVDLVKIRTEIENLIGRGPDQKMFGAIHYTPRVKKVMAVAEKKPTH